MTCHKVNLGKSTLIVVGDDPNLDMVAADLGCKTSSLPVTYLGLPLGPAYKRVNVWNPIIERVQKRLIGWKANYLSKSGRLTLLKTALGNIPVYYMLLLNIPKVVASRIERLQREFLWRGGEEVAGLHLVAWDKVCSPKSKGGFGLRHIVDMNIALLCKWLWRLGSDEDWLWKRVVMEKYCISDVWNLKDINHSRGMSLWKRVMHHLDLFQRGICYDLGKGDRIASLE